MPITSSKIMQESKRIFAFVSKSIIKWLKARWLIIESWDEESELDEDIDWANNPEPREDWFLSLYGAVPEAACSWLRLLHDTQSTNLNYTITTKRLSIDYLPRDVTRPLATADRGAFLVTLTLLGTEWSDRGADGIFVGRSPSNNMVVTSANIPSVGTVYSYDRTSTNLLPTAAKISIQQFRVPYYSINYMFNNFFLLAFHESILTWSKNEMCQSLTKVLGDVELANHFSQQYVVNGLNIGIGELIASWSMEVSMPRRNYYGESVSAFSSSSLGCTYGMPLLSAILCNNCEMMAEYRLDKKESIMKFVEMIEGYYSSLRADIDRGQDWLDRLIKWLEWASLVPPRSNIMFHHSFVLPDLEDCYNLMAASKQGLDKDVEVRSCDIYLQPRA